MGNTKDKLEKNVNDSVDKFKDLSQDVFQASLV